MRGDVNGIADGRIDPRQYRQALGRYATGVTVVTTRGRVLIPSHCKLPRPKALVVSVAVKSGQEVQTAR